VGLDELPGRPHRGPNQSHRREAFRCSMRRVVSEVELIGGVAGWCSWGRVLYSSHLQTVTFWIQWFRFCWEGRAWQQTIPRSLLEISSTYSVSCLVLFVKNTLFGYFLTLYNYEIITIYTLDTRVSFNVFDSCNYYYSSPRSACSSRKQTASEADCSNWWSS